MLFIMPLPNGMKVAVFLYQKARRFSEAHRNRLCAFKTRLRNHLTPLWSFCITKKLKNVAHSDHEWLMYTNRKVLTINTNVL